jgi:hypothetical protein
MKGGEMSILGWNDIPGEAFAKYEFWKCPTWIRALARLPILEILAYPLIVKRGFATIWIPENCLIEVKKYESKGWKIRVGEPDEQERLFEGSIAKLTTNSTSLRRPKIAFTRWGRELSWQKAVHTANGTLDCLERSKHS